MLLAYIVANGIKLQNLTEHGSDRRDFYGNLTYLTLCSQYEPDTGETYI